MRASDGNRQTVVVVDDEPDILDTLVGHLDATTPADIVGFARAARALEHIEQAGADLLLTDFRMPEMDGLELLRRSHQVAPGLGAMMITAYPELDLAIDAVNEGRIVRFFTKPTDPDDMAAAIRAYLAERLRDQKHKNAFRRAAGFRRRR